MSSSSGSNRTAGSSRNSKAKKNDNEVASVPPDVKDLRACLICSLIKTHAQFELDGCDNCDAILNLAGRSGSSNAYTSCTFEGIIAMIDPVSWVGKWQRIDNLKKGVYAVSVKGDLAPSLRQELIESGFKFPCRDRGMSSDEVARREREMDPDVAEERDRRLRKSRRRRKKKKEAKRQEANNRVSESSEVGSQEINQEEEVSQNTDREESEKEDDGSKSEASAGSDVPDEEEDRNPDSARIAFIKEEVMSQIGS